MSSIVLSLHPKAALFIFNGIKRVELRKSKPKLPLPFKCFCYVTYPKTRFRFSSFGYASDESLWLSNGKITMSDGFDFWASKDEYFSLCGKVIGYFTVDKITPLFNVATDSWERLCGTVHEQAKKLVTDAGLTEVEVHSYSNGKNVYAWHISDFVVFDKPFGISNFYREGDCDCLKCKECAWFDRGNGYNVEDDCSLAYVSTSLGKSLKPLFQPPQSWCYVDNEKEK